MFKIGKFNLILIISICLFMNILCVCASDISSTENSHLNNFEGNTVELENTNDNSTIDELNHNIKKLSSGDIYNMDRDYYDDENSKDCEIHICKDNITINGNGHIIDGKNKSLLFNISGENVKIYNLTFKNSHYTKNIISEKKSFKYESTSSLILWQGDNGIISNCKFYNNSALNIGGAITWIGNNGLINNSIFENDTSGIIGGAIYITGSNNTIHDCFFCYCNSQIGGEAIYIGRNHNNCSISAVYLGKKLISDGNITNITADYFNYICESVFCGEKINLISIIYSAMISQKSYINLNKNTTYYCQYLSNQFILTLTQNLSDDINYKKIYHFNNIKNYNDVYLKLINNDYKIEYTFTKHITVMNENDYENARTIKSGEILSSQNLLIFNNDLNASKENSSNNDITYQLEVEFADKITINSKNTWNPSENAFDAVNIIGHGSTIKTNSGNRDENKWVSIKDNALFSTSNLTVEGFNTAVENLGGISIFNNLHFNKNHMNYWFERDWGAAILNSGYCICTNCSFTENKCGNGGAIFNQAKLILNNCTFKDNDAYKKGNNVLNAKDGIVYIDGKKITGSQGCVEYVESISTGLIAVINVIGVVASGILGTIAGMCTLNPAIGIALGAGVALCIGGICSGIILSNIYDVNVNRLGIFITVMVTCTLAGALGGYLGTVIAQAEAAEVVEGSIVEESLLDSSFSSSEELSELSLDLQEYIANIYTDSELNTLIAQEEAGALRVVETII